MDSFENLLRSALMTANWRQFENVYEQAESEEPDFSLRYRRMRQRILSDPFGWAKRQCSPWKSFLKTAACFILICSLALGTLMTVSPTVRATVIQWISEIRGNMITYFFSEKHIKKENTSWRPSWLPQNWGLSDLYTQDGSIWWEFEDQTTNSGLTVAIFDPSSDSIQTAINDIAADEAHQVISILGYTADYYEGTSNSLLVWENSNNSLFWLNSSFWVDKERLISIAEHVIEYSGPQFVYKANWVPDGYVFSREYELGGANQTEWEKDGIMLTLQYVTDPMCPWVVPDRPSGEIDINGMKAQYWANQVPENEENTVTINGETYSGGETIIAGDTSITTSTVYGIDESGVLVWTDKETNTTFLLKGTLTKSEFIKMAKSIYLEKSY